MKAVPDIYDSDWKGLPVISARKVMKIIGERDELRCAVETMAKDLAMLATEVNRLTAALDNLKRLGDVADR